MAVQAISYNIFFSDPNSARSFVEEAQERIGLYAKVGTVERVINKGKVINKVTLSFKPNESFFCIWKLLENKFYSKIVSIELGKQDPAAKINFYTRRRLKSPEVF